MRRYRSMTRRSPEPMPPTPGWWHCCPGHGPTVATGKRPGVPVEIHLLPELRAVNIVLQGILGRGVADSNPLTRRPRGSGAPAARYVPVPVELLPQVKTGGSRRRRAGDPEGQRTRARLVTAAGEVFCERGFNEDRMSDIAERARGVAHGTVYVYFETSRMFSAASSPICWRISPDTCAVSRPPTPPAASPRPTGGTRQCLRARPVTAGRSNRSGTSDPLVRRVAVRLPGTARATRRRRYPQVAVQRVGAAEIEAEVAAPALSAMVEATPGTTGTSMSPRSAARLDPAVAACPRADPGRSTSAPALAEPPSPRPATIPPDTTADPITHGETSAYSSPWNTTLSAQPSALRRWSRSTLLR